MANTAIICKGGHIQTKEAFLYGRFETLMKPAYGSGIVSSFFTFSDAPGWQNNWQEIDGVEFLGRNCNQVDTNIIRTVNGVTDKNINVRKFTLDKRCSDHYWKITIEWMPDKIVWKINDAIIRTMNIVFNKPQKLMANIWAANNSWAGEFNAGLIPQTASYEYIQYFAFVNGELVPKWRDSFHTINENRWMFGTWAQGITTFAKSNVLIKDRKLELILSI